MQMTFIEQKGKDTDILTLWGERKWGEGEGEEGKGEGGRRKREGE